MLIGLRSATKPALFPASVGGAALSLGHVTAKGCLECPFHGWQYDGGGACVRVPLNVLPADRKGRRVVHSLPTRVTVHGCERNDCAPKRCRVYYRKPWSGVRTPQEGIERVTIRRVQKGAVQYTC